MGTGLGKNSPVKLTLGKDNYEALIDRHGQWIRWRIASKCSCVQSGNMQPDIHCPICSGRGFYYTYQKSQVITETVMLTDTINNSLQISEENAECEFIEVYDFNGRRFPNAEKLDNYILLNPDTQLTKGVYYTVVLRNTIEKEIEEINAVKGNLGYYTVPGLTVNKSNIDGIYYNASSDIVAISEIKDAAGIIYQPKEFRLNQFRIEPTVDENGEPIPITEPVTLKNVKYIPPFIFALLNQNLSKADMQMMVDLQGDAVCTFPYNCDVANDDVLTVLAGSYTQKEVMIRSGYKTDTLGVYYVYDVVSCTGLSDGIIYDYKEGIDFILVENNKIKWLEDGNYPEEGETYSITYHVLPTYKVVKQIPQLRTSENQRFPKKAVVKIYSTYAENTKVNKQAVDRKGIDGSY